MQIKDKNEITVKILCKKEELEKILISKGFKHVKFFNIDDYYFVPQGIDLLETPVRDIIAKCVIVRNIFDEISNKKYITYKEKNIAENGDILSQKAINCNVESIEEAKALLNAIGYKELMNIKEKDTVYSDGKIELAVKEIKNGDILMEIEFDDGAANFDALKEEIKRLELPIEPNQYFVKKAEIELERILDKY